MGVRREGWNSDRQVNVPGTRSKWRTVSEGSKGGVLVTLGIDVDSVSLTFASGNQLDGWLRLWVKFGPPSPSFLDVLSAHFPRSFKTAASGSAVQVSESSTDDGEADDAHAGRRGALAGAITAVEAITARPAVNAALTPRCTAARRPRFRRSS